MQIQNAQRLMLDEHNFREVMREAYDLLKLCEQPKYYLLHEDSFPIYNKWAPYVFMNNISTNVMFSPGFKMAFLQLMSVIMALKSEGKSLFRQQNIVEENPIDCNVIDFLSYKSVKRNMYN
jgi:hypothetical protein